MTIVGVERPSISGRATPGVDRRDEADPQRGQPRRDQRHRDPRRAGGLRATRPSGRASRRRRGRRGRRSGSPAPRTPATVGRRDQVARARRRSRSAGSAFFSHAGRDHRRQPLHEVAQRPVGLAPRADDHPGAEVGQRRAVLGEDAARSRGGCAGARTAGGRRGRRGRRPARPPRARHPGEVPRRAARSRSAKSPAAAAAHRVDQVVRDLDVLPGPAQALGIEHVALVQLEAGRASRPASRGRAPGSAPPIPVGERVGEAAADEPGRAGHQGAPSRARRTLRTAHARIVAQAGARDRAALRLRACRAARSSSRFSRFRRPCSRSRCCAGSRPRCMPC